MADSRSVFAALSDALNGDMNATVLSKALAELDAYRGLGRENVIARFSAHKADSLPKTAQHGAGETVGAQLTEKLAQHDALLQLLNDAGAFPKLHASVLRVLLEDGQRLRALLDLRELESRQQEQRARGGGAGPLPLREVVLAAGRACVAAVVGGGDRDPGEAAFYASPTSALAHFFREVAAAADAAGVQPGRAAADFDAVAQLSRALQAALGGALQQRAHQQQLFGPAVNASVAGVDEASELTAGAALQALAAACCRLHPLLAVEAPQQQHACMALLSELTDRVLNACAAAVAAAPPGQRRALLHREYAGAREALLGALLAQAAAAGDRGEALRQLARVRGMAEAHAAHAQLFDVADATADHGQLHQQMLELRGDGLDPPLATYVFSRLLRERRLAELLDLPPQLDAGLARFLRDADADDAAARRQLRWLHELRVGDYGGAAAALAQGAQGDDDQQRARAAALQKLSALAASPLWPLAVAPDAQPLVAQADAALEALGAA